jgi:Rod binding domain-containing protein
MTDSGGISGLGLGRGLGRGEAWPVGADLAASQRSFAGALGRAVEAGASPGARAREAAEQLVAQTFVVPMLKELRQSDRSAPPFAPSQGEKQFRALMDVELAQRMVKASRFGLVERLARDLLQQSEPAAEAAGQGADRPRSAAGADGER